MAGGYIQHVVELGKELGDPFFLVFNVHAFDSEAYDIDCREREVTAADRCFRTEAVLEYTRAASHGRNFVHITLRIIGTPVFALVECRVEVEEVREETASCNLAGKLVKVVVTVFRQIAYPAFLFPYLNREDGRFAIADSAICAFQYLANDTASFGRSVRSVIDGTEYYLVASTRMDGVHIVDKGFHRLMHAADSFIDGMLDDTFIATQSFERTIHIVIQFLLVEM